ncbi:MAG: hypothetical protein JRF63_02905 [Deltaproteobacteria bacterium]|nr:hypothetical protein [Deltaproteobacteria bacterium]
MIGNVKYLIAAIALIAFTAPTWACDGTPPKLINKDAKAYEYEIVCASKTEKKSIPAGGSEELREKSGCKLKLGSNKPTKLFTEMVCTIKDGKLTCDLL